ncbi:hypothetical protein LQW54_008700 [Pestalotiopsis sp. IQ-011]
MEDITNVHSSQRRDVREPAREGRRFSDRNQLDRTHPGDSNTDGEADATALLQQLSIINSKLEEERLQAITIHPILHDYLKSSTEYLRAVIERNKGWANEEADTHFKKLQESADNVTPSTQRKFYEQMVHIGHDMDRLHSLSGDLAESGDTKFLDLCMSPGGFSGTILENAPGSRAHGISLPVEKGGHPLCIDDKYSDRMSVQWMDITMLSSEMGVDDIPADHPDFSQFTTMRPYEGLQFGLVFCDGNVLRIHERATYRETKEHTRLLTTQLVLAFQRIKKGGTLVCRFHKIERLETARTLHFFTKISKVAVFKPVSIHGARSSFYMIAKDIQIDSPEAIKAVEEWKQQWREATLDAQPGKENVRPNDDDPERVKMATEVVQDFGPRLIQLAEPIWKIQTDALLNKPFNTGRPYRFESENDKVYKKHGQPFNKPHGTTDPRSKLDWRRPAGTETPDIKARPLLSSENDWRRSDAGPQDIKTTPAASAENPNHYVVPQRRRSSVVGKKPDLSRSLDSEDAPRAPLSTAPRHLWGARPFTTTAMNAKGWRSQAPEEKENPPVVPDHPVFAPEKVHACGIGKPGGSLTSNPSMRASNAPPDKPTPGWYEDSHQAD